MRRSRGMVLEPGTEFMEESMGGAFWKMAKGGKYEAEANEDAMI